MQAPYMDTKMKPREPSARRNLGESHGAQRKLQDKAASAVADMTDQIRQTVRDQGFFHKLTAGEGGERKRAG